MNETYWAWIYFLSAVIATYIWRFAAVMISNRIKSNHPIFEWVTCLSYGIIGALVANSIFFPTGILIFVPLWQRLTAITISFLGFYFLDRRLVTGIIFGETALIILLLLN
mgnify:CR=1 FL=1|tara:strand:- start:98 stop:427 length:330 start_codon:yes stop_codon:yes gene_type:complete